MPLIAWATDLHLDHATEERREALCAALRHGRAEMVIVTGDTSLAPRLVADLTWLADAARRPVYLVLGNHDHYHGSVASTRDSVIDLTDLTDQVKWLPPAGVVPLDDVTALIGVDGWADGAFGDPLGTPLVLNDDRLIAELAAEPNRSGKLAVRKVLAEADAARLGVLLERAAADYRRIVAATHVPPFVEALPARGHLAGPEWLPLLVCGATGAVLSRFAAAHPGHDVTVLAGHTHVATSVRIAPNLRCMVGGARYGSPAVTELSV